MCVSPFQCKVISQSLEILIAHQSFLQLLIVFHINTTSIQEFPLHRNIPPILTINAKKIATPIVITVIYTVFLNPNSLKRTPKVATQGI